MQTCTKEIILKGIPICRGIAVGKPFFLEREEIAISEMTISENEAQQEVERYRSAMQRSLKAIKNLQNQLVLESSSDGVKILESQLEILRDPLLNEEIEKKIFADHKNAEFILQQTLEQIKIKFKSTSNTFFLERYQDLHDLTQRILGHLVEEEVYKPFAIPPHSIICAEDLNAIDIAAANPSFISAFIITNGGSTSHAAIIAKSKGIPFITNINLELLKTHPYRDLIVDSRLGKVILNPEENTLTMYNDLKRQMLVQVDDFQNSVKWPAETFDGFSVNLLANLEMPHEIDLVHEYGGQGVGLFRSEYLLFPKNVIPSEEEQYTIYRNLIEKMRGLPIVIRTFDLGGDKSSFQENISETTDSKSRTSRSLLKQEASFKTQLRAILRASFFGEVRILFPMISTLSELKDAKRMLREVREELNIIHSVRVGCMIEVPSAALNIDHFVKECDFLSIGTNDLVQYSLAVDRREHHPADFHVHADPSLIKLVKFITNRANKEHVPVTICGEIASDPRFTPLLLGLGIQELSVAPRYIPLIKNAIRNTSIIEAIELAEKALQISTAKEVMELLAEDYQKNVPQDLLYNVKDH